MIKNFFILGLFMTNIFAIKYAKIIDKPIDLGSYGKTYPIVEPNFYDVLDEAQRDFNVTQMYESLQDARAKAYIVKNNLPTCQKNSFHYIDPTLYVKKDIKFNGKFIAKRGQIINPIDHSVVLRPMLILDIDSEDQLNFWRSFNRYFIVLTGKGDIDKFYKKYKLLLSKVPKSLIKKFKIKCLPSMIVQDGRFYKVKEYKIEK